MIEAFGMAVILFWLIIACVVVGFLVFLLYSVWKELLIFFAIGAAFIIFLVMLLLGS
jgi:membrane protein implicated in regulation of membrane protease activity